MVLNGRRGFRHSAESCGVWLFSLNSKRCVARQSGGPSSGYPALIPTWFSGAWEHDVATDNKGLRVLKPAAVSVLFLATYINNISLRRASSPSSFSSSQTDNSRWDSKICARSGSQTTAQKTGFWKARGSGRCGRRLRPSFQPTKEKFRRLLSSIPLGSDSSSVNTEPKINHQNLDSVASPGE